jgi:hypothetical protein
MLLMLTHKNGNFFLADDVDISMGLRLRILWLTLGNWAVAWLVELIAIPAVLRLSRVQLG